MNRQAEITNLHRLLISMTGIVAGIFWVLAMGYDLKYFFVAAGTSALLVTLLPIAFHARYDWFCPWSALILAVIYGCFLPSICMTFNLPSEEIVNDSFLLHQPVEFFVKPTLMLLGGFVLMAIGYFGYPARLTTVNIRRVVSPPRLMLVCTVCGVIAFLSFAAYFVFNGGLSGGLSNKRGTISTLDVGADQGFSQYGYLRHFAKLGYISLLMLTAYWCKSKVRFGSGIAVFQLMVLGTLFLLSIAFPFYSSSRAAMVWVVIGFVGTLYYMDQRIFTPKTIIALCTIGVLFGFATFVRNSGDEIYRSVGERVGRVLLNRHGPDIAVTSHVVQNIPHKLEYQNGKTIAVWLIAPIPRELMPNKPLIHSGPIIGQQIFGTAVSGVPPGIIAELYWNFHVIGVLFGCILFGAFLKIVYQTFQSFVGDPVLLAPIYLFAIFPMGFKAATHSVGPAMVMPVVDLVTVCTLVYAVSIGTTRIQAFPTPLSTDHGFETTEMKNAG